MRLFGFPVFLIILLYGCSNVSAQGHQWYFKHITLDQGLPSNKVNSITQDHTGFMWFGTENGLAMYDGSDFKVFKHNPKDRLSLCNNSINCIYEDPVTRNLWIGTDEGLNYFNKSDYKFYQDISVSKNDSTLLKVRIFSILKDHKQNLWIATYNGLYVYFADAEFPRVYGIKSTRYLSHNSVFKVFQDSRKNIWIGTQYGVELFRWNSKTFHPFPNVKGIVNSIYEDSRGHIWVATYNNGLYTIKNNEIKQYTRNNSKLGSNSVQAVVEYTDGNMLIAVRDGGGLHYLDTKTGRITIIAHDDHEPNSINSSGLLSIYKDKFGNIWIGTWMNGLNMVDNLRKPFLHYKRNFKSDGLYNNNVRSVFQDSDGDIWVGTKDGGCLSRFDPRSGKFLHYKNEPGNPFSLSSSYIFSISEVKPGTLLIGTFKNGLDVFEKHSGKFYHYKHKTSDSTSIVSNDVYCILRDRYGVVWVATVNRLQIFDFLTKKFTTINKLQFIRSILDYSPDEMYFGGRTGLFLYKRNTREVVSFTHNINSNSISDNYVTGMVKDSSGNLWIATYYGGVNHFDTKTRRFTVYAESDGLASNHTRAIQLDDKGNLWISTTNGLSKFDPKARKFKNYSIADGLQGKEFERFVSLKAQDGHLLFGGTNGFNYFHPDSIKENENVPNVVITGFKIFNKQVPVGDKASPLHKHISSTEKIILTHKQSYITFEFVALNFTSAESNQYAYCMEGLDSGWNYVGNTRNATYSNVPPGAYTFRVKASNNDGIWNEEGTSVIVRVLPPWWKTLWFRSILIVLLLIGIVMFLRHRTRKLRHQKQKLVQVVKERNQQIKIQKEQIEIQRDELMLLKSKEKFIQRAMEIVLANISDPSFGVREFVEKMNMSRSTLHEKLVNYTGQSAVDFITSVRLKKAAELMSDPDLNVTEIAEKVGYNDPSYFGRCFKKQFGKTPKAFIESLNG